MNIIEAIKERRSVRTFNGEGLSQPQIDELVNAITVAESPFVGDVTMRLRSFDLKDGFKPSTYGVIKGASDFFLLGMKDDKQSALTAGFKFEQVILKAWQMGLGTCWIAATFKGTTFNRGETWPEGEELRIISPVGVAAKKTFVEKVTRFAVGSKNRKPFDKLFFRDNFHTPYNPTDRFGEALEMLRLAPSSTNSQPWRALIIGDTVHFYYAPKSKLSVLDCGIGLCHFFLTEKYNNRHGVFEEMADAPTPPDNWVYLTSYSKA